MQTTTLGATDSGGAPDGTSTADFPQKYHLHNFDISSSLINNVTYRSKTATRIKTGTRSARRRMLRCTCRS